MSKKDKEIERIRYDSRAKQISISHLLSQDNCGSSSVWLPYRAPYLFYEKTLDLYVSSNHNVLEIGSGTGEFTDHLLINAKYVVATDISPSSLSLLKERHKNHCNFSTKVCDMEALPFANSTFDICACAGSLSYGDNTKVMNEIYRILKPNGLFICIDSLNHNPIYKVNRFVHYLRGKRTLSTLKRMPNIKLINSYSIKFGESRTQFFGSASWLAPFLSVFLGERLTSILLKEFDVFFRTKKSAFKFVMVARKLAP